MARQRRGSGGFRPPELRGTLGTLLRTTWQQAGAVRDAIERGAREGRSRLDEARAARRRQDALAELGELVLDLIRRGEVDLAELPEAGDLVRYLDELDADAESDDQVARPTSRTRFDDRAEAAPKRDRDRDRDDGTIASAARVSPSRKPAPRVWRPPADEPTAEPAPTTSPRFALPRDPHRQGGIAFEDDDDLAEYMHPDDVPPKPRDE